MCHPLKSEGLKNKALKNNLVKELKQDYSNREGKNFFFFLL